MKKIFFALAALVLAFTGCSQEEDAIQVSEKKAVKVVVNMDKPGFGEDTRAARQGWEPNDEVVVTLAGQLTAYVKLTYQEDETWKNQIFVWQEPDGEEGSYVELTEEQSASFIEEIEGVASTGSVKAVYFSSGVLDEYSYYYPGVDAVTRAPIAGAPSPKLHLTTNASYDEDYPEGECVMTCEDGTYSVSDGDLTLNILMIPQVAQFTIRGLSAGTYATSRAAAPPPGATTENVFVWYKGTFTAYAGGGITADGIELEGADPREYNYAWLHENEHGVSFYASPWEEIPDPFAGDFTSVGSFSFQVKKGDDTYSREFTGKTDLGNGDAVIMDGPTTEGATGWATLPNP